MKNQFLELKDWMQDVLSTIKKDLKSDHLTVDPTFYKAHFGNRPPNRLSQEELLAAYEKELLEGTNEELLEFAVNRWVFKHGDLYQHFADKLTQINPDFDQIKDLTEGQGLFILEGATEKFGAIETFLFSVLNGVVFPKKVLDTLRKGAEAERVAKAKTAVSEEERQNLEKILNIHQREVARLHDKITGVQKKYTTDTEALKKQIRALQKQLVSK